MRFVRCGSKMFDLKAVTAVDLNFNSGRGDVMVIIPGGELVFHRDEADAVRAFFSVMSATDLMHKDEAEAPEAGAVNHGEKDC